MIALLLIFYGERVENVGRTQRASRYLCACSVRHGIESLHHICNIVVHGVTNYVV